MPDENKFGITFGHVDQKMEVVTSGQVVQKIEADTSESVGQKKQDALNHANKNIRHGKEYDYYFTDSDNDGITDVNDVDDYNPDVGTYGDVRKAEPNQTRKSNDYSSRDNQSKNVRKKIVKNKNDNEPEKPNRSRNPKRNKKPTVKCKTAPEKAETNQIKKKSKLSFEEKQPKKKSAFKVGGAITTTGLAGREAVRRYEQLDRFSDAEENSALQAAEVGKETVAGVARKSSGKLNHGLKNRTEQAASKRLETKSVRLSHRSRFEESLKTNNTYQKPGGVKKQFQKIKLKRAYNKKVYGTYTTRMKKGLRGVAKAVKQAVISGAKRVALYAVLIAVIVLMMFGFISSSAGMMANGISVVIATSYQTNDLKVTEAENIYTRLEADLRYAIENVEADRPGYDEYRYYIDDIYHDPHMLIAYLTAKYGDFTSGQAKRELSRVFDEQYRYNLIENIEKRTKTVTVYTRDPDTGEMTSERRKKTYNWYILEVYLDTSSLESVLLGRMNEEETELYDTYMESKGNFQCLPSPLRENWKGAVSSMYGYRLDPFNGVVEFHTGIDIARPLGTELVAVFDGTVTETGYDSGYGNYIVLEDKKRHTVLYAHCQSVSVSRGDVVETGQQVGTMGSTGNSTGSHLHFEVRDADGNRLNPYFYLSEEIAAIP